MKSEDDSLDCGKKTRYKFIPGEEVWHRGSVAPYHLSGAGASWPTTRASLRHLERCHLPHPKWAGGSSSPNLATFSHVEAKCEASFRDGDEDGAEGINEWRRTAVTSELLLCIYILSSVFLPRPFDFYSFKSWIDSCRSIRSESQFLTMPTAGSPDSTRGRIDTDGLTT